MTERPILFSGAMVRAILDGRKTMTRRIVKKLETGASFGDVEESETHPGEFFQWCNGGEKRTSFFCPYGKPGDRLWVRETHAIFGISEDRPEAGVGYKCNHPYGGDLAKGDGGYNWICFEPETSNDVARMVNPDRWRPSIFMPRWASRITLEITGVRVERLNDISEDDVDREGIYNSSGLHLSHCPYMAFHPDQTCGCGDNSPREEFAAVWDRINGKRTPWESNPYVWVISFRRIKP